MTTSTDFRTVRALIRFAVVATLAVARSATAAIRSPLAAQDPSPDHIPSYDSLFVRSRALGEVRRVNIHFPSAYRGNSTARFPVLYMPDGGIDEDFPHVVNTVDSLIARGVIRPVIVVGVPNTERRRDLTGPTRVASDSAIAPHVGGSAAFRRFFVDELRPVIDARYRTTNERAIVGESLAGLFIVETFLREPSSFQHYVAFDPSLWWNHGALVDSAAALVHAASVPLPVRTLFIAVSADGIDDVSTKLADILRAAATPALALTFTSRRDLGHGTIFRALAPAALAAALR
jgi:predicted alpha/beta superfamily hydrolase